MEEILNWCASILGPFEMLSDHTRSHPGSRTALYRLRTPTGYCYLKTHRARSAWETEVHAYEQWAPAFGSFAPRLLAVRAEEPLALVISELPGQILAEVKLSPSQERAVWRAAGQALVNLHDLAVGPCFGPCRRDGACSGLPISDAQAYLLTEFEAWVNRGVRAGCLSEDELTLLNAVRDLIPAFAGEPPVPCHRDYGPDNWLVTDEGTWAGVIDFEFAYWDVRVADFTRYPNWEWIHRPDLLAAFHEGYGRSLTPQQEQQRLVAHALYALNAIVWGHENAYYGFAAEGHQALKHLAGLSGW